MPGIALVFIPSFSSSAKMRWRQRLLAVRRALCDWRGGYSLVMLQVARVIAGRLRRGRAHGSNEGISVWINWINVIGSVPDLMLCSISNGQISTKDMQR